MGNSSQSYGASPAMWDQKVFRVTQHRWMCHALTPARQAGTRFTYPGGIGGWVELVLGWSANQQTVTHPSTNHLTVWPNQELNPQPLDRKSNVSTVATPMSNDWGYELKISTPVFTPIIALSELFVCFSVISHETRQTDRRTDRRTDGRKP